ncbi:WD40 repeat domain-containing serine/threonine protein kinase [Gemmata sp.]|uniref:WD40 repeat domain-containing serine/threonine protein kinase n=1 Tax=Gemmata sp. TaxID=1914242 RepID=UPI003F70CED7
MPEPPRTGEAVLDLIRKSELADDGALTAFLNQTALVPADTAPAALVDQLVAGGVLTAFQGKAILLGKCRGFRLGPYRILDQIGSGGMGQVFLAEHAHMRRRVAVKVLPLRLATDKAMVERFYREARAVAALDHPNIVRAHDVGCHRGTHYLVLEYIEGRSLADRLAAGGPLPVGLACAYVVQAAAGLKHAHDKGLAHRDIKPGNILVDRDGVVKILDMGLARFFEDERDRITRDLDAGSVMGTADYVAPEQLTDSAAADHRADIYSLGATFYHLLTGRPPFDGTTTAKLLAHQVRPVAPAHVVRPEVPPAVSAVIERMMAKAPADRYQTVGEVVTELLPYVGTVTDADGAATVRLPPIVAAALSQSTGLFPTRRTPVPARKKTRGPRRVAFALAAVAFGGVCGVLVAHLTRPDAAGPQVAGPTPPDPQPDPPVARPDPPPPDPPKKPPDDPNALAPLVRLDGGKDNVEAAVFTPGDRFLVTAGGDGTVRVWDGATGAPVRRIEAHADKVRDLALLPGGRRVLSAGHDRALKLWDLDTGACLHTYHAAAPVTAVAALPDGRRFLAAGADGSISLWDADTETVLKQYPPAPLGVFGLAVTRDGRRAVAATWDLRRNAARPDELAKLTPVAIWVFDVESGREVRRMAPDASVAHVALSRDGRLVAFGTGDGVGVWDVEANTCRLLTGLKGRTVSTAFTRDGRHLVSTGLDWAVTVWDAATGRPLATEAKLAGPGLGVAPAHDGRRVAVVGARGEAAVWRLPAAAAAAPPAPDLPRPVAVLTRALGLPEDVAFSSDGASVVGAASVSRDVVVWNASTGAEVGRVRTPEPATGTRGLAALPGDLVASCSGSDPAVRVWSPKAGKSVRTLTADKVTHFTAVAAAGDRVFATANDRTVRAWAAGSDDEPARVDTRADCRGLAVAPDGARFVVGCTDRSVRLFDVATKAQLRSTTSDVIPWRLAVSPDGKWAAFGTTTGVTLWNLDTGETRALAGAEKYVDGVAFTRNGRFVLGGSADRGLYTWEVAPGRLVGRVADHTNLIRSVALSPDGTRAVTSSTDGTGVVWQLPDSMAK